MANADSSAAKVPVCPLCNGEGVILSEAWTDATKTNLEAVLLFCKCVILSGDDQPK
jgi:hypothetical protein